MGIPGNQRKIVFTVINDLTYDQRMNRICTSLAAAGYDVLLVGRSLAGSVPLKNQAYRQKRLHCFFNKGKLFYAEYNIRLLFFLLFTRFDIICSIDLDTLVPGYLAGKLKGKPVVFDAHEYFTEVPEVINRPSTKRIWEWVANTFIPKVKYCYTVGPMLAELFTQKYGTRFETIMNAPVTKPLPSSPQQPNVLLYQGALNKGRGIEHYIDMMPMLPDFQLWIVGEGDLSQELRVRAIEKNVDEQVKFLGKIEPEKLFDTTCAAFIGLNVSENLGMSYYYSLNNKFFDHIHAVLPSVTNKFPEYTRMNEKYKVMVFADATPQSVAEQVKLLAGDKELYLGLKENCLAARSILNWENEEKKLVEFYKNVR